MATGQGDGSILLTTEIDTKGIDKGFSKISSQSNKLADGFKKVGATLGKAFLAAGAAATTAAVAITKASVEAYADYEQLVGGVETLFKGSSKKLIEYANEAYRTSGLSANQYMETVTGFSASLLQSLGGDTEKAADVANMALIDMSDNANKMGTSMEMIQNAYQGFAKQNYTMLDNLKLGYGGTKEEMARLLADAQKLTGVKYDMSNLSDVYNAIHAIQENLGIAGTTAKEAATTISGSAAMMKASWQNVLVAIAGGGDLNRAIANLVDSISIYFQNIVPVIERALAGIGALIQQVAPMLVQTVARSLIAAIPNLLSAVYNMIIGIAKGIYQGIVDLFSGKTTAQQGFTNAVYGSADAVEELAIADKENLETVTEQAESVETTNSNQEDLTKSVKETNKELKKSLANFDDIQTLSSGMSEDMENVGDSVSDVFAPMDPIEMENFSFNTPSFDMGGFDSSMAETPTFLTKIYDKVRKIFDLFSQGFWQGFGEADFSAPLASLQGISQQLSLIATEVAPYAQSAADSFVYAFGQIIGSFASIGITIATNVLGGIELYLTENSSYITERVAKIFDASGQIATHVGNLWSAFANIFSVFADENGIGVASDIIGIFSNAFLSITELATLFASDFIGLLTVPIEENQEDLKLVLDDILGFLNEVLDPIKRTVTEIGDKFSKVYEEEIGPFFDDLKDGFSKIVEKLTEAWKKHIQPVLDNFADKFDTVMEEHVQPMIDGIVELIGNVADTLDWLWVEHLEPFILWFIEDFGDEIAWIVDGIGEGFNNIVAIVSDVVTAVTDSLNLFLDFMTGDFEGTWSEVGSALKDMWIKPVNGIIGLFEDCINGIILSFESMINWIIDALNTLSVDIPDWVPGVGGKTFGLNISRVNFATVSIPRLAQGAVIPANHEFLAVLGDQKQGTNVETPLSTMIEAFQTALDSRGGYSNGNIEVVLELDGREFGRAVVEQGNRENRRIGTRLVVV
jgi:phage-related protein